MKLTRILKVSTLSLALALTATAAKAHDQTDCELEGEQICDESDLTPIGWENCAWLVAVGCYGHSHQIRPGSMTDKVLEQLEDHRVQHRIQYDILKLKLLNLKEER